MTFCQLINRFVVMNKTKRNLKPIFGVDDLGENPFLSKLEVKVNTRQSKDKYTVFNINAGEDAIFEYSHFEYEDEPYCKVFATSDKRLHMVKLPPRTKDLLMWIMYELKPGKDFLWLNKVRYMSESKIISVNTFKTALNELIKKRYLGKTVIANVYWINPEFIFNGNRIKSFPNNLMYNPPK